jgi:hypothetical protein
MELVSGVAYFDRRSLEIFMAMSLKAVFISAPDAGR